jgi:hypothetical protein
MAKSIYQIIIEAYPELESSSEFINGSILLQNDSDGKGDYIAKWDYAKPLPEGLTIGKSE